MTQYRGGEGTVQGEEGTVQRGRRVQYEGQEFTVKVGVGGHNTK